jgi:hypothetical protein
VLEPRSDGRLMAEIPREVHPTQAAIVASQPGHDVTGPISATVVDQ